jgi:hypothetical protein
MICVARAKDGLVGAFSYDPGNEYFDEGFHMQEALVSTQDEEPLLATHKEMSSS